jgi:hypothetical protein
VRAVLKTRISAIPPFQYSKNPEAIPTKNVPPFVKLAGELVELAYGVPLILTCVKFGDQ